MTIALEKIVPTALGDFLKRTEVTSSHTNYEYVGVHAQGPTLDQLYQNIAQKVPMGAIIVTDCVPRAVYDDITTTYFASGTVVLPVKKDENSK